MADDVTAHPVTRLPQRRKPSVSGRRIASSIQARTAGSWTSSRERTGWVPGRVAAGVTRQFMPL